MREFWKATEVGLRAYETVVEARMHYPRHRELASIMNLGWHLDCYGACWALEETLERFSGRRACVVGPAWSGPLPSACEAVAAPEGAVPALLALGIRGDLITADMDAALKYIGMTATVARVAALHIHGDNMVRFSELEPELEGRVPVFYTTQVEASCCVVPVGAFTDGDRAAALAMYMGAGEVRLLGFNLATPICGHKDFCDSSLKALKIELGLRALDFIASSLGYVKRGAEGGELIYSRPL